jgi:hypothetical protein
MKIIICFVFLIALTEVACVGEVITANFDDLPAYTEVGDHYTGSVIWGYTYSSWSMSAPNCIYSDAYEPMEFPNGASWVSFYSYGISVAYLIDIEGTLMSSVTLDPYAPGWQHVELSADRPTVKLGIVKPDRFGIYYIDDLTYELVPEPASVGSLAGMIGLFGVRYRRRARLVKA